MTKINLLLFLLCCFSFAACRKNNEATVWSAPPSCESHSEVLVDGKCVLKPEYNRFGRFTFFRSNPLWVTTNGCSSIDSAAIAFKVDTLSGGRYFFSLSFEEYQRDKSGTLLNGSISEGTQQPSFFPDAVRGDSVFFILRTENFDPLGNVYQQPVAKFYGRFNPQRTELRGRVAYFEKLYGSETGEVCENVVFKPFQ